MQIENLQEQLKDKEKQMTSLKERVKSLQTDTSNTDTALTTLEEALSEKVDTHTHTHTHTHSHSHTHTLIYSHWNSSMSCCSLLSSLVVCFRVVTVATFSLVWLSPMECSKRPSLSYTLANWTDIAQILLLLLFIHFLLILIFSIYWNWSTGAVFLSSMLCL